MDKLKEVFSALPEINEIWITEDGNHHLHPHYGGKRYTREDVEEKEVEKKDSKTLPNSAVKK